MKLIQKLKPKFIKLVYGTPYNAKIASDKYYGLGGKIKAAYAVNRAVRCWNTMDAPRLRYLRNLHTDRERGFVICNGPSLNDMDLSFLKNEITIGVNALYLKFEEMGFKPNYYIVEDELVGEDRSEDLNNIRGTVKLYALRLAYCLKRDRETIFLNHSPQLNPWPYQRKNLGMDMKFSEDASIATYGGNTVTFTSLQMAYHLGLKEVYIIGADHNYKVPEAYNDKDENENYVIEPNEDDVNHFDPSYFGKGYRWHNPKVHKIENAYRNAKILYEAHGRKIFNATLNGSLEIFERVNYMDLFKKGYKNKVYDEFKKQYKNSPVRKKLQKKTSSSMLEPEPVGFLKYKINQKHFDGLTYLSIYPDVKKAITSGSMFSALDHYKRHGRHENRFFPIMKNNAFVGSLEQIMDSYFDGISYLEMYADVRNKVLTGNMGSAREHFLKYGVKEGRKFIDCMNGNPNSGNKDDLVIQQSIKNSKRIDELLNKLDDKIESQSRNLQERIKKTNEELSAEIDERLKQDILFPIENKIESQRRNLQERIKKTNEELSAEVDERLKQDILFPIENKIESQRKNLQARIKKFHDELRVDLIEQFKFQMQLYNNKVDFKLSDQENMLRKKISRLDSLIQDEKKERLNSIIEDTATENLPKNVLIIMSIQRSGSTWLFDSLRVHPGVDVTSKAIIYRVLGLNGGRYPKGLSDLNDGSLIIEQNYRRRTTVRIPEFVYKSKIESPELYANKSYSIEKIHPMFFDYDTDRFLAALDKIKKIHGTEIKLLYLYRQPEDAIKSFLEYQLRNSSWYSDYDNKDVLQNAEKSYATLLQCARRYKGMMLDYESFNKNYEVILSKIFNSFWGETPDSLLIAKYAKKITERDNRLNNGNTSFIKSHDILDDTGYKKILQTNNKTVKSINSLYDALNRFKKI